MKNSMINTAITVTRLVLVTVIVFFLMYLGIIVYSNLNPDFFEKWVWLDITKSDSIDFRFGQTKAPGSLSLQDIGPLALAWLYIRMSAYFVLVFLMIKKGLSILLSVKNHETFHVQNVKYFKQLSLLALIIAAFKCLIISPSGDHYLFNFNLPFEPLLFSLACRVMAEVFLEGGRLSEDSNSII